MKKLLALLLCLTLTQAHAAQWLPLFKQASGGGAISFTPTDFQALASSFSPVFSKALAIGPASSDRIVVVCLLQASNGTTTPTYNGSNTFTVAAGNASAAANAVILYANITSGTTMVISFPGGAADFTFGVGYFTGQSGGGAATMINPQVVTTNDPQPLNTTTPITFVVPASGIGIACGGGPANGGAGLVFTWTGTTNSAGDENAFGTGINSQASMAHMISSAAASVSSTGSLSFNGATMAYAAMNP